MTQNISIHEQMCKCGRPKAQTTKQNDILYMLQHGWNRSKQSERIQDVPEVISPLYLMKCPDQTNVESQRAYMVNCSRQGLGVVG